MNLSDFNPIKGLIWFISILVQSYQRVKWYNSQDWMSSDWRSEMRRKN